MQLSVLSVVVVVIAVQATGCAPPSTSTKSATSSSPSGLSSPRCLGLTPGTMLTQTARTCDVAVGRQIAGVDCSTSRILPSTIAGATGDATATYIEYPIPIMDGSCHLAAELHGQVVRMYATEQARDVVAVTDFTSTSDGAVLALYVRCGMTVCVGTSLRTPSELIVVERAQGQPTTRALHEESYQFSSGHQYRLVVVAHGDQVRTWIDGAAIGPFTTALLSTGFATFSIFNETAPAGVAVNVRRFYVYQLAS